MAGDSLVARFLGVRRVFCVPNASVGGLTPLCVAQASACVFLPVIPPALRHEGNPVAVSANGGEGSNFRSGNVSTPSRAGIVVSAVVSARRVMSGKWLAKGELHRADEARAEGEKSALYVRAKLRPPKKNRRVSKWKYGIPSACESIQFFVASRPALA